MAENIEVLVLDTSHFSGVGSSPTPVILFHTKYCFPSFDNLPMVSSNIIHAIYLKTCRQDGRVE